MLVLHFFCFAYLLFCFASGQFCCFAYTLFSTLFVCGTAVSTFVETTIKRKLFTFALQVQQTFDELKYVDNDQMFCEYSYHYSFFYKYKYTKRKIGVKDRRGVQPVTNMCLTPIKARGLSLKCTNTAQL